MCLSLIYVGAVMKDKYKDLADEELVKLARSKDITATTELVTRYLPFIRQKAAGYCLPGMEAEDIVQEGLIGFLKALGLYDPEKSSFKTFLSICVTSSIATAAKAALSLKGLPLRDYTSLSEQDEEHNFNSRCYSPEQHLLISEQASDLFHKLETMLSPFEKRILTLYLSGHSYVEISALLQTSSKAVDNALQRIRRKLRS